MSDVRTIITWLLVVCLMPFFNGCEDLADSTLTGRLWDGSGTSDHSAPGPYPHLSMYQTADHKDLLVVYDELNDNNAVIKRRAYLLNANERRIESGHKPRFIGKPGLERLQPVPVETNSVPETNVTNVAGLRVVLLPDHRHFALLASTNEIGIYYLPVYVNKGERSWRIALTPLTLTADVAIYGAVAAVVAGVVYLVLVHAGDNNSN